MSEILGKMLGDLPKMMAKAEKAEALGQKQLDALIGIGQILLEIRDLLKPKDKQPVP